MKITVLSGSPKGKKSITLQSVRYLQKHYSTAQLEIFHVGQRSKALEQKTDLFESVMESVQESDGVLWCYPVYTFLVPSQFQRFLELIFERGRQDDFAGKYAAQLSTSKHFFDHTAYNYIHQISEDLGLKHLPGLCADMEDLTTAQGRQQLLDFGSDFFRSIRQQVPVARKFAPIRPLTHRYTPTPLPSEAHKNNTADVLLLTDSSSKENNNLSQMIEVYRRALPLPLRVINIDDISLYGGCLGCFQCAFDEKCAYNDGFDDFHRQQILPADSIIMATSIQHHGFSSRWKCYEDRQFYNGHRTTMMGKSVGYILSGPLRQEANLRQVLEARSEVSQTYLLDILTDEEENDETLTAQLVYLAQKTAWAIQRKPQRPQNFLGVGGMKIFRDLVFVTQGLMQADHRFYLQHGLYDFPHKQYKKILQMKLLGLLLKWPQSRKKMSHFMSDSILKQYNNIIERY